MTANFKTKTLGLQVAAAGVLFALSACSERVDRAPAASTDPTVATDENQASQAPRTQLASDARFELSPETPDSIAAVQTSGVCSLENIVTIRDNASSPGDKPNSYKVKKSENYRFVGFATNKDRGIVPADIEVLLSGLQSYSIRLTTGRPRDDVAQFFNNPSFANAGYMHDADFSNVAPGDYAIYVLEHDGDKKAACSTNQSITVL